jgi:molybdate transport system substrate-binding protein
MRQLHKAATRRYSQTAIPIRFATVYRILAVLIIAVASLAPAQGRDKPLRIAAASDLKFALTPLVTRFEKESAASVAVTLGASGNLARQIQQGAPFEVFLSADESLVHRLVESGHARDAGFIYAIGRVAFYVSNTAKLTPDEKLAGLREHWHLVQKFAIANPEHAPYGRAARESLESLGLWDLVKPKIVLGENVTQAAQFVSTGAAQAGLIAHSLAMAPELSSVGRYVVLPSSLHQPLRQRAALMRNSGPVAADFFRFLQRQDSREHLRNAGFSVSSE